MMLTMINDDDTDLMLIRIMITTALMISMGRKMQTLAR